MGHELCILSQHQQFVDEIWIFDNFFSKLGAKLYAETGIWICPHCLFNSIPKLCALKNKNYLCCIYLIFPLCVFKCGPQMAYLGRCVITLVIFLWLFSTVFSNVSSNCLLLRMKCSYWLHLFDFSLLCIIKRVVRLSAPRRCKVTLVAFIWLLSYQMCPQMVCIEHFIFHTFLFK